MDVHQIYFSPGSLARKYIQNEFLNDLNNIFQEFYEICSLHNQIMSFIPWFITTYLPLFINVLERSYKDGTGNIIKVVYPPQSHLFYLIILTLDKASTSKNILDALTMSTHFSEFKAIPMDLFENFANEMENSFDFKNHISLEFNKLQGYPKKNSGNTKFANKPSMQTYYYSRPTPQDVLIEERDWNQTNTSYSGSEIYEWNLDGLTDRQLTILVHKMLMYATICKNVKNTDRNICKIIITDFTGQLRGW
ncbi:hypothetical protein H5410_041517 [Solanum commersonii]|uniref:Uncharacterized protein n=1 Tax=Solanum commersonii TaxID=4109 RepID=A0A9J5XRT2_SOLCO|nr:hypothetical protein H5410_041517 [Solanum commersonii]